MKTTRILNLIAAALVGALAAMNAQAQTADTRIGKLEFDLGLPTEKTVAKLFDEMDFQRAVQSYLWALPTVNIAELQRAHEQVFGAGDVLGHATRCCVLKRRKKP